MRNTTHTRGLLTASYLLRMSPADKAELEAKARAYTERTGQPMTLAEALRQGARAYLDAGLDGAELVQ